jgi:hypothetical protein
MEKSNEKVDIKKKSKVKKIFNWIIAGVFGSLLVTITIFNLVNKFAGDGFIFGSQYPMVLTDSMEPEYMVGDVLIINKVKSYSDLVEEYRLGDDGVENTDDDAVITTGVGTTTLADGATMDLTFLYDIAGIGKEFSVTHRISRVVIRESLLEGEGRFFFTTHGINTDSEQCATNGGDCTNQTQSFDERKVIGRVQGVNGFLTVVYSVFTSTWGLLALILIPAIYLIITSVVDIVKTLSEKEEVPSSNNNMGIAKDELLSQLSPKDLERLKKDLLNELLDKGDRK